MKPIVTESVALTSERERVASLLVSFVTRLLDDAPGSGHGFASGDVERLRDVLCRCAGSHFSATQTTLFLVPYIREAVANVRTTSIDIDTGPYWNLNDAVGAVADSIPGSWPLMTNEVRQARVQHALEHLATAAHAFASPRLNLMATPTLDTLHARATLTDTLAAPREQLALLARQFVQRLLDDTPTAHTLLPNDVIYMRSALEFAQDQKLNDSATLSLLAPVLRRAVVNLQQAQANRANSGVKPLDTEPYWSLVNMVAAIGDSVPGARPMMTEQDRAGRLAQARADLDHAADTLRAQRGDHDGARDGADADDACHAQVAREQMRMTG